MKFLILIVIAVAVVNGKSVSSNYLYKPIQNRVIENVLRHVTRQARLIGFRSSGPAMTEKDITNSLISNYTTIREEIKGGFTCREKVYGYYADVNNDCQIFHICVPMEQLFPKLYEKDSIMEFSFICPKYTIFSQAEMVCAWERSAIPCEDAPKLYYLNKNFFVVPSKNDTEDINKIPKSF